MLVLAGLLGLVGLAMVLAPSGFGRVAHEVRVSIPAPSPATEKVSRGMGLALLAAAMVVLIAWA